MSSDAATATTDRALRVGTAARAAAVALALGLIAKLASAPGQSFFLAVFVDDVLRDTGVGRTAFSGLYAAATVVSATMVLWVGRAIDRAGAGAVWLVVAAGLAAACLALSAATGLVLVLIALCFMRGFGQGSFPLLGTVIVASSFEARRGRAMAVATQGITLAGVLLPGIAAALIAAFGWRAALQIVAATLIVAILPLGLAARRSQRPTGARADGRAESLRGALRRPGVPRLLIVLAAAPLVSTALVLHSVSLLGSVGLSAGQAAAALGAMAACVAVGAAAAGAIADRCAVRWSLAPIGVALIVAVGLLLAGSAPLAFAGFLALGLATGLSSTANGTVWAKSYGTAGLGRLQGMSSSAQIGGAAAGPLVLALSASATGGYAAGLMFLALLSAAALALGWRWRADAPSPMLDHPLAGARIAEEAA